MPLPAPTYERTRVYTRNVVCRGFERVDGTWDIEGTVTGARESTTDYDISMRLTIDATLNILEASAVVDTGARGPCEQAAADFSKVAGISLARGFKKSVIERIGEACTHIIELLGPVGTTAYQAAAFKLRRQATERGEPQARPPYLGTCHTWALDGPTVKRELPQYYTGK